MIEFAVLAGSALLYCTPVAIDGDTIKCGGESIRLLGIDAPEMPGHCRQGRVCVQGNPHTSKANLSALLKSKPLRIERVGKDRYDRTLALVSANGVDFMRSGSCRRRRLRRQVGRWRPRCQSVRPVAPIHRSNACLKAMSRMRWQLPLLGGSHNSPVTIR